MKTKALEVPFGMDENGGLVVPREASKEVKYACPSCGDTLILRKGSQRVAHFAHGASGSCTAETVLHATAKRLIVKSIVDWKAGASGAPVVVRTCPLCRGENEQKIPDKVTHAALERRLETGFVGDVVLFAGSAVAAAIEVRVSHAVTEDKAERLSIPFIEVEGSQIVLEPGRWLPIIDSFKPFRCQKCEDRFTRFQARVEAIAQETKTELPDSYYRHSFVTCYRCERDTLVFTWPGQDVDPSVAPRKEPRPKQLRYSYSKTRERKYWGNRCSRCDALQGDWFLYREPEGPFFGFRCGGDTPGEFRGDQKSLAYIMDNWGLL